MSLLPYVQPGNALTLTVPFVDTNGAAILGSSIASLAYGVFDSFGDDLIGLSSFPIIEPQSDLSSNPVAPKEPQPSSLQATLTLPTPAASDTGVTLTVSANFNVLQAPYPNPDYATKPEVPVEDVREVRVQATLKTGAILTMNAYYRIVSSAQELVIVQNSFQTYTQSLLVADRMVDLGTFATSNRSMRIAALKQAYDRLTRYGYYVRWPRDPDAQNYIDWRENRNAVIIPRLWVAMDQDRWFNFYPEAFRETMRRAQVYEADAILTPDPYASKRDMGVVSETIGPASITFKRIAPAAVSLGLNERTLRELKGYINMRMAIERV